jgi:hypothetical protein
LFNPQPTARKSLFCTHVVLSNATIRTTLDLSSIKIKLITCEKVSLHGYLDSITSTSTVSLSTSTTKSDAMHERTLCRCKLRLRRASPTVGSHSVIELFLASVGFMPARPKSKAIRALSISFLRRCEVSLKH